MVGNMNINEIGSNLTGGQIQKILDHLLFSALRPLVIETNVIENILPRILVNVARDKRRKISVLPHNIATSILASALHQCQYDKQNVFKLISEVKIERNVWSSLIHKFLTTITSNIDAFIDNSDMAHKISKYYQSDTLWEVFMEVDTYFEYYSEFKGKILSQYINKSHKFAHGFASSGHDISHDDLAQAILISVSKGLDKYDSGSGALSSYLGYWMMNTSTSMSSIFVDTPLAFDIPSSFRQKIACKETTNINFASSLSENTTTSTTIEDNVIEQNTHRRFLEVVKIGDIDGVYRLSNGISEVFNQEEREIMRSNNEQIKHTD